MSRQVKTSLWFAGILSFAITMRPAQLSAQSNEESGAVIEGIVCDSRNEPIAGAAVSLDDANAKHALIASTDSRGHFRFEMLSAGTYVFHTKKEGYGEEVKGPFVLQPHETKSINVVLRKSKTATANDSSHAFEFSDEPKFTVAGVTDTTSMGGHGSERVMRNSDALVKDTASLAQAASGQPETVSHTREDLGPREAKLRALLAQNDSADLHAQLADIEENEGHSLGAVREYQRAAEMQPSEEHLFAWGAELLLHRAFEPSVEVFSKGRKLYPDSARMMLGLGAAKYAQGSMEDAGQIVMAACDLHPADATPYLFLGRLQETENSIPPGWTVRMKRFVMLHPKSAMAHYLYAVALEKQEGGQENFETIETQLQAALKLDPSLGDAYLQLGILLSQRKDYAGAIVALQKAIETTLLPDEAHYRLADVYRRTGEIEKAAKEADLFKQCSEKKQQDAERERHEIQRFVYTLKSPSPTQSSAPKPE